MSAGYPRLDDSVRVVRHGNRCLLLRTSATGWLLTDEAGVAVAEALDGASAPRAVAERLYGATADAEAAVSAFVDELREANLLTVPVEPKVANGAGQPVLESVYVELTTACDLRCRHCYVGGRLGDGAELSWSMLDALLADAAELGAESIALSGGDPLLHPDWERALDRIIELGMRPTVLTNGLRVDDEVAAALAARRARVQLSLDGDAQDHDRVRGAGTYARAMLAVERLLRVGLVPGAAATIWRLNADRSEHLVEACLAAGLGHLDLRLLQPVGHGAEAEMALSDEALHAWTARLSPQVPGWRARGLEVKLPVTLQQEATHHRLAARPRFERGAPRPGCPVGRSPAVSAEGKVYPCSVFLSTSVEVGDLRRESLREVLAGQRLATVLREAVDGLWQACGDCALVCLCLGGCRATAWAGARRWAARDRLCPLYQEAYHAAFFGAP